MQASFHVRRPAVWLIWLQALFLVGLGDWTLFLASEANQGALLGLGFWLFMLVAGSLACLNYAGEGKKAWWGL